MRPLFLSVEEESFSSRKLSEDSGEGPIPPQNEGEEGMSTANVVSSLALQGGRTVRDSTIFYKIPDPEQGLLPVRHLWMISFG